MEDLIIVGIDPGLSGGICFLSKDKCNIYKIPNKKIIKNNKTKKDYDVKSMYNILTNNIDGVRVCVFQEWTHAMPGNGGVSMYSFGRGHGIWEGIVASKNIEYNMVSPQTWKKFFPSIISLKSSLFNKSKNKALQKQEAIKLAKTYNKSSSEQFCKTCDGMAESFLITLYAWNKITGINHYLMNN